MNQHLQSILDHIQQSESLSASEKNTISNAIGEVDKILSITEFKLERTEKEKSTTAILLEETIEELEQKRKAVEAQNRELEIESSLERVRSVAMGMKQPADMLGVCHIISDQLQLLHVADIRNVQTAIIDESKGTYNNYQYFTQYQQGVIEEVEYNKHPKVHELVQQMQRSQDAFFSGEFKGKELEEWRQYRKDDNQFPDHILDEATAVYYYFYSIGQGGLGVSTYTPLMEDNIIIFKRFRNVFDLAYRRFLDIQQAEAQAREAQIEAALERVRVVAMGMIKDDDLRMVCEALYKELKQLGFKNIRNAQGGIIDAGNKTFKEYSYSDYGSSTTGVITKYTDDPLSFELVTEIQQSKDAFFKKQISGDEFESWRRWRLESGRPNDPLLEQASSTWFYIYSIGTGGIGISTLDAITEQQQLLLKRFKNVFELTYSRFHDLQKAEAQVREAQIEASLERVRAKAMAMHKSEDLNMAVATVFEELDKLDLGMARCGISILDKEKRSADVFTTSISDQGKIVNVSGDESIDIHPLLQGAFDAWVKQTDFSYVLEGKDLARYYQAIGETNIRLPDSQIMLSQGEEIKQYFYIATFQAGCLFAFRDASFSEEAKKVMKRFADVFNLTYTRFLDLQKAEAQAREAQIEAALERVRASAMAMHKSEDLHGAVKIMFEEFQRLNLNVLRCGVGILNKDSRTGTVWATSVSDNGLTVQISANESFDTHPLMMLIYQSWQKQEDLAYVLQGQDLINYYKAMDASELKLPKSQLLFPEDHLKPQYYNAAMFNAGGLYSFADKPLAPEDIKIMKRFASVVNLTYNRFLDLQKAEAQAREAIIEAALERVRGKAMAMHSSKDLSETINAFFKELKFLGIVPVRCGLNEVDEESQTSIVWVTTAFNQGDSHEVIGKIKLSGHPVLEKIFEGWKLQQEYYPVLSGADLKEYYKFMKPHLSFPHHPDSITQYGSYFYFKEGLVFAWTEKELSEEEKRIFRRFTAVISLTYRRYMELQKSEANAKDALRQSSLDRVRAEIASMRTTVDLERITPLIWNELTILGVPFIRCGVFIMDEELQLIHTFLSTPEGKAIAAFHLPYSSPGNIDEVLVHWKKNENYIDHWDEAAFIEFANVLVKEGALASPEKYLSTIPKGGFYLHFLPFLQGMLYVGNSIQLSDDEIKLVQSVADAFSTAYARYEDFNKLESAKQQVDNTLTDLKQAQQQLVQSEKMASLGELTAGIAHEIQNPLNFVNNFSEVNAELIDELKDELATGNWQQASEIAESIKENEEKIVFHGKRADAIVKGMLHHSRTSSGVKEPTDINALTDEYLRLAYHGLRAKDKSFNAKMKTVYDPAIGLINIVPQDMGRVVLNLITNAFYTVTEKKKHQPDYAPTVEVVTRKLNDKVEIRIRDNGGGIPQNVVDKIFQPFFTTKPSGEGTGLGLSLSYDIIKAHGGDITVETKIDHGTTFIISLPQQK